MNLAFSEVTEAMTEARLGFPGKLFDPAFGAFLSLGELGADLGRDAVVGGLFDEDPTGVRISAFADTSSTLLVAAGAFGGDEAEEGHELFGVFEAAEGSDFADGDHGGDELEAFECHEGVDERFALPVAQELEHRFFEPGDTFDMKVDGGEVVLEDAIVGGIGKGEVTEVAQVGFGPVGLSVVVVAKATKHCQKSGLGAAKIIDGVGAGSTKVAYGFVNAVGNVNRDEVIGAEAFCKLHGVAFVSFDAVTGFDGNERGCDDITTNAHLKESPGNPEPAPTSFVADVEITELPVLVLCNFSHHFFQSMLGGGDGAVVTRFGITITFEDGDDSFCFMDVKSEVECLWCV